MAEGIEGGCPRMQGVRLVSMVCGGVGRTGDWVAPLAVTPSCPYINQHQAHPGTDQSAAPGGNVGAGDTSQRPGGFMAGRREGRD